MVFQGKNLFILALSDEGVNVLLGGHSVVTGKGFSP